MPVPAAPFSRTRTALAVMSLLSCNVWAQTADPAPVNKADKAVKADKKAAEPAMQKVEVKGSATRYDPRRDDTASKTVLNADEIRKYGDDNIFDVLKRAPGVNVTGKTLRMRGLGAGYTQILVNGDRPPPGFSLDNLMPDQIERIEIIGAASAEFSMQAIAGTINIVLKKVTAKPQRDLRISANHSQQGHGGDIGGTLADRTGNLSWFLNGVVYGGENEYASWTADRFTAPDGTLMQSRESVYKGAGNWRGFWFGPRLSLKLEDGDELNAAISTMGSRNAWGGASHTENLVGTFPQPDYVESSSASPSERHMVGGELGWIAKLAGGKLDLKVSGELSRFSSDQDSDAYTAGRLLRLQRDWDTTTRAHRASLRAKYTRSLFDGHAMAAGFDTSVQVNEETRDQRDQLGENPPTRTVGVFEPRIRRLAGFVQDEWSVDSQVSLYLGARWEGVKTDSESSTRGELLAPEAPDTHSNSHVLSPVLQTLYKFPGDSGQQLRFAYTRTYKAPEIGQLTAKRYEAPVNTRFNADSSGNPDLRPELANGIDITWERFLPSGAMMSASVSRRAISDYIRTRLDLDENGRWVYQPINDGDALVRSLQLEAKLPGRTLGERFAALDLRGSISRNWSEVAAVPGPDNRLDAQTPMSATLGVDYRKGNVTTGASLAWQKNGWVRVSEEQFQYQQVRRDLDAYLLYKFSPRYQTRLSLGNLLGMDNPSDRYYRDASGISRTQGFNPGSVRVGVNLEAKM